MKITWIGQAGLYFVSDEGTKVLIDPYLSNSAMEINPRNERHTPIDKRFLEIKPDILIFTHNHIDHYDPETAKHYLKEDSGITVLCPSSVWDNVRQFGGNNNYVMFNRHTQWTEKGLTFKAVKAEHSDLSAIGVIVEDGKRSYYVTGDTLYNTDIFNDLPQRIDIVFLPINGMGNNMNVEDAVRFVWAIGARKAVPMHYGMFDRLRPTEFEVPGLILPELYKEF